MILASSMLKRSKIAGKAFQNLMFHHHYTWSFSAVFNHRHSETLPVDRSPPLGEYEFCCSNSPTSIFSFPKKQHNRHSHFWERDSQCFPLLNFDGAMLTMGSSLRFPMYDNDFGWGKPVAVRSGRANKFDGKSRRFPGERAAVVLILRLFWRRREWRESDPEFMEYVAGELKKVLTVESGLQVSEQRLAFRGKDRENWEYLDRCGVKNRSKVILTEDPQSKEKRYIEMRRNAKLQSFRRAVSDVSMEIDKLAEQVSAIEKCIIGNGKKVAEVQITTLTEMLMSQAVKLDSIPIPDNEACAHKVFQGKRVQKCVETLDALKESNSRIKPVVVATTGWETFDPPPLSTAHWEHFD